ncbi:MAG: hypothetical protein IKD77_03885 [Bacilli bacterium]|nr:hypothetical protein [Bacilli bacterium]
MKKNIVIGVLILIIIIMGGTLYYLYSNKDSISKDCPVVENKEEQTSITGNYIYDGVYSANPDLTAHLELKLNSDNTFVLYESVTDAMAFRGTYTLNDSSLMLYAIEMDASQDEPNIYEVSSDTFECTYDATSNTVNINKWNQHWYNSETKKVDYNTFTNYGALKLTSNNDFKHIGKDRFIK